MYRSITRRLQGAVFGLALLAACLQFAAAPISLAQDDAEPDATVKMLPLSFSPAEVHIPAGGTVLWVNTSRLAHTVTADDQSWDSGYVDVGETFSMTFDTPGTYSYYCVPHGGPGIGMAASVIVE